MNNTFKVIYSQPISTLSEHEQNQNDQIHLLNAQFNYLQSQQKMSENSGDDIKNEYELKLNAMCKYLNEAREQDTLELNEIREENQNLKETFVY